MAQAPIEPMLREAARLGRQGQSSQAREIYLRVLEERPRESEALHRMGMLSGQEGRLNEAADFIERAIAAAPHVAQFHLDLGDVFERMGKLPEAAGAWAVAVLLQPGLWRTFMRLAQAYAKLGQPEAARVCYQRAAEAPQSTVEQELEVGVELAVRGAFDPAIACLSRAVVKNPNWALAHCKLGEAIAAQGKLERMDEAVAAFQRAIWLQPNLAQAHQTLGIVWRIKKRPAEALASLKKAIALDPKLPQAHLNIGHLFKDGERFEEAKLAFSRAIEIKPDYTEALCHRGACWLGLARYDLAEADYQRAIESQSDYADARWHLAQLHLLRGDFARGWREYEARWNLHTEAPPPKLPKPRWQGEPIEGKTLMICTEQGYGDCIQFARFIPEIIPRGARMLLACSPPLKPLLAQIQGIEQVVISYQNLPPYDVYCSLLSLPLILGTTLQTLPAKVPYLRAEPERVEHWRRRVEVAGHRRKIGLAWDARKFPQPCRSMPLATLAPLAQIPNAWFCSLQKGDAAHQAQNPPPGLQIADWTDDLHDFADTAALVENLDLVITVDTAITHLAGALAKPAWVMVPFVPDWRWLLDREDTPWYPTVRLFRQKMPYDWNAVVSCIAEELCKSGR